MFLGSKFYFELNYNKMNNDDQIAFRLEVGLWKGGNCVHMRYLQNMNEK